MAKRFRIGLILVLTFCAGGWHWFEPAARQVAKGVNAFQNGAYDAALDAFVAAKGKAPDSPLLRYNTAASLLRLDKAKEALEELSQIDGDTFANDAGLQFNKGNAFFKLEDYPRALEAYKKSLLIDPNDLEAKRNFELTLKKIKAQQKPQSGSPDQDKSDQDKREQEEEKGDQDMMQ